MLGFRPIGAAPICELFEVRVFVEACACDNFVPVRKKPIAFDPAEPPFDTSTPEPEVVTVDKWRPYQHVPFRRKQFTPPVCDYPFFEATTPQFGESSNRVPVVRRRSRPDDAQTPFVEPAPQPEGFGWLIEYAPPMRNRRVPPGAVSSAWENVFEPIPVPEPVVPVECPYRPKRQDQTVSPRNRPVACEREV